MSTRPLLRPELVVTNGNMASQIISIPTFTNSLSAISYDVSWTGTSPVGVVTVQVSNTYKQSPTGQVTAAGDWNTLPLSATCNVTGNADNGFIDVTVMAGHAIRLVYTPTSGTGTMNVTITGKVQ